MIPRYTLPEMAAIWSEERKYATWLEVEVLACEAWARLGRIPAEVPGIVRERARLDLDRIRAIEAEVHHDVIAFTTSIAEQVGEPARYVHFGLTSSDVVDTAQGALLKAATEELLHKLRRLHRVVGEQAVRHRDVVMVGRTHGVHAEPTTLGLKLALWYAELGRDLDRLERARDMVAVGKISGAVGTYAHVDPFVETYVCERLGLVPEPVSSQVVQRDRHAEYLAQLAVVAGSLDRFATEIRGLQRTEIRELEEPFARGQKGSSAMPHKRNPEKCERVSGLARLVRGYAQAAFEDQALWHERDISHSSVERVILPDATTVLHTMIDLFTRIVSGLHVYPGNMRRNLEASGGLVYSQRVLLALVEAGMPREAAYRAVQDAAMAAWRGEGGFRDLVAAQPEVRALLDGRRLDELFDPGWYVRHVPAVFERLGLV